MDVIAAGPVALGTAGPSILIRNVPAGQCSYACVYCCLGGTEWLRTRRRPFYPTAEVVAAVRERVEQGAPARPVLPYLTFLPGGEPTLDCHIGIEMRRLGSLRLPVAVVTNASLLWRPEVRSELLEAERITVKLDAVDTDTWRRLNRPARQLRLKRVLEGIEALREEYRGRIYTRTAIIPGLNDSEQQLRSLAAFLNAVLPTAALVVGRGPRPADGASNRSAPARTAQLRLARFVTGIAVVLDHGGPALAHARGHQGVAS